LEAGRGLATPLLVVMKINTALKMAFDQLDPALLSDEARRLRETEDRIAPPSEGGGFREIPLLRDPGLEQLMRMYNELPGRPRQKLLPVVRATAAALTEK